MYFKIEIINYRYNKYIIISKAPVLFCFVESIYRISFELKLITYNIKQKLIYIIYEYYDFEFPVMIRNLQIFFTLATNKVKLLYRELNR